jgi:alpha-beta hydrolase superfamily lysophospholipase
MSFRYLERSGEPRIAWRLDVPNEPARGRVLMVHGYADHSARFTHVAEAWTKRGLAVARLDLRGHGESEGPRGHVSAFSDYVSDVRALFDLLQTEPGWTGGTKPVLFGHSMGALIASHSALVLGDRISGLALTSPFIGVARTVPPAQVALGRVLARFVPGLRQPSGLKGSDCTRNTEIAARYDEDPLRFKHVTIGWFNAISQAQRDLLSRAPELRTRLFCVAAGDDRVVSLEATRRFFALAGSTEKELDVRDGLYHEVLNEPEWEPIAARLAERMLAWSSS